MRFTELAGRNLKEVLRDPLSISVSIVLPVGLMLILGALGSGLPQATFLGATMLVPGIALFGFSMLVFSSGFLLARDRESALLARLLTTPLRPTDFVAAYSVPFIPVAIIQMAAIFAVGAFLGLDVSGRAGLAFLILLVMSFGYIGLGMVLGSTLSSKQVGLGYTIVLLPTIFSGLWFDMDLFGGVFQQVMNALPFAHALEATRAVMVDGTGFDDIATDLYWVLGYTVVFFGLGVLAFRRKMLE